MIHLSFKNLTRNALLIFLPILVADSSAVACKMTAESGEAANKAAILKTIEADKDLNGFKIIRISHKINIYSVKLKKGTKKQTVKYEVIGQANCEVDVRRIY